MGDKARIQVFEPSGVWRENISLSGLSSTGKVTALAVDSAGNMFVKDEEASGVREIVAGGAEKATQFDAGSNNVEAIALDSSADLVVGDSSGGFHVLKFDGAGKELASFGSKTLSEAKGMTFSGVLNELYVSSSESKIWVLPAPPSGPLVEPGSQTASAGQRGHAEVAATVNPEGNETTYRFQYVSETAFRASGYAGASSTPEASIGAKFEDQALSASLSGLTPAQPITTASSPQRNGTATGPDQVFTEIAPALIDGPWASNVASTSATLSAEINPLGASTEYVLEYGTTGSYGQTLTGNVGAGEAPVLVSYHRQELLPGTVYHYRIVTHNEVGTVEGPYHTFTTQLAGGESWRCRRARMGSLVVAPKKKGALIEPPEGYGLIQAASDGDSISYQASVPVGADPLGYGQNSQVYSIRSSNGWESKAVSLPRSPPEGGEPYG